MREPRFIEGLVKLLTPTNSILNKKKLGVSLNEIVSLKLMATSSPKELYALKIILTLSL